jgi:hypothetical protein
LIVLDASLIIAHVLGESTIAVDSSIFDTLRADTVIAPAHWSAEVASAWPATFVAADCHKLT